MSRSSQSSEQTTAGNNPHSAREGGCSAHRIQFQILKNKAIIDDPPKNMEEKPNTDGSITCSTTDEEWIARHVAQNNIKLISGRDDFDWDMVIVRSHVVGDPAEYKVTVWYHGKPIEIPPMVLEKLADFHKWEYAVFDIIHEWAPANFDNKDWKKIVQEKCEDALIEDGEFHDAPVHDDFVNFIELATPVFSRIELDGVEQKEGVDVSGDLLRGKVWYDTTRNEIRPSAIQIRSITDRYKVDNKRMEKILKPYIKAKSKQERIIGGGFLYFWRLWNKTHDFPAFMAKVNVALVKVNEDNKDDAGAKGGENV